MQYWSDSSCLAVLQVEAECESQAVDLAELYTLLGDSETKVSNAI